MVTRVCEGCVLHGGVAGKWRREMRTMKEEGPLIILARPPGDTQGKGIIMRLPIVVSWNLMSLFVSFLLHGGNG